MPRSHLLLSIIIWLMLLFQFWRAHRSRRLEKPEARKLWAVFFCGCLAFTLGGEQGDLHLNVGASTIPVGLYSKYFGLLGAFYLYFLMLRDIEPERFAPQGWLHYLAPIAAIVGVLSFMVVDFTNLRTAFTDDDVHLGSIAFRDAIIIFYIIAAFLPVNTAMWQREQVPEMKIKHVAGLVFFVSLFGANLGNVLAFFAFSLHVEAIARILPIFSPFILIAVLSFIVLLLPHKALEYPARLYVLYKLQKLEKRLRLRTGVQSPTPYPTRWMLLPHKLKDAIYLIVVIVGDYFPHLDRSDPVYQRMLALMSADPDYPTLVRGLADLE